MKRMPLARSDGLLLEEIGAETVVYDSESGDAHCLSPLAAAVFAHCDGSKSVAELAKLAGSRLGEPVDKQRVEAALVQLGERALLAVPHGGISRRTLVRRTAAATAAFTAVPLITSIVTPAFAQTAASPSPACPRDLCASQQDGDVFCNTVGVPQEDSCECENCSALTALGIPCPTPQKCVTGVGGCTNNANGGLDGLCVLVPGDT